MEFIPFLAVPQVLSLSQVKYHKRGKFPGLDGELLIPPGEQLVSQAGLKVSRLTHVKNCLPMGSL